MKDDEKSRVFETSDEDPRMTEDDTKTDAIERGEKYHVEGYGIVRVMDISRKINSIDLGGVTDETLLVKFNSSPEKDLITDRDLQTVNAEVFLRSLQPDK